MAKNTSVLLGEHFDNFINEQVKTGKYASASEVMRAALRMFEREETKKEQLIKALIKGEKSGFVDNFDRNSFLDALNKKYVSK
jgi:antitoxin ParD1/3/4